MECDLKDKVIVVTGATRGIGKVIAEKFLSEGAYVVINYKNDDGAAIQFTEQIKNYKEKYLLVKADVADEEAVKRLYKNTLDYFGHVDAVINNAGICSDNYIQLMNLKNWEKVIDTNLKGTFLCTRLFGKQMIKQRKGKIINISSLKGQLGSEGQANYAASKAAIIGLTKSVAKELGSFGISVNAVCPGYITTGLNVGNSLKTNIACHMSLLDIKYAQDDLINFLVWICSDKMNGISGQVFNLDSRVRQGYEC